MVGPEHFNTVADVYQLVRPPYPAALWRDVLSTGLVGPGRCALDLGAGTGEATGELLARGMNVTAVEPGHRLASLLELRLPTAALLRVRAEELRMRDASFDLVVAATSLHWMNLDVVLPLVHRALTLDGRMLVWRNVFGDPSAPVTPFRQQLQHLVDRRNTARAGNPENADATAEKIVATRLFSIEAIRRYRWSIDLTSAQVLALFGTFSDWTSQEVREMAQIASELGGTVREHYSSWLIVSAPLWSGLAQSTQPSP